MKKSFLRLLSYIKNKIKDIMSNFNPNIEDLKELYVLLYDMKRKYELSQYDKYNSNQKYILLLGQI